MVDWASRTLGLNANTENQKDFSHEWSGALFNRTFIRAVVRYPLFCASTVHLVNLVVIFIESNCNRKRENNKKKKRNRWRFMVINVSWCKSYKENAIKVWKMLEKKIIHVDLNRKRKRLINSWEMCMFVWGLFYVFIIGHNVCVKKIIDCILSAIRIKLNCKCKADRFLFLFYFPVNEATFLLIATEIWTSERARKYAAYEAKMNLWFIYTNLWNDLHQCQLMTTTMLNCFILSLCVSWYSHFVSCVVFVCIFFFVSLIFVYVF